MAKDALASGHSLDITLDPMKQRMDIKDRLLVIYDGRRLINTI